LVGDVSIDESERVLSVIENRRRYNPFAYTTRHVTMSISCN